MAALEFGKNMNSLAWDALSTGYVARFRSLLFLFLCLFADIEKCRLAILFVCIWISNAVLSVKVAIENIIRAGQHQRRKA